jgi:hypothetical protein
MATVTDRIRSPAPSRVAQDDLDRAFSDAIRRAGDELTVTTLGFGGAAVRLRCVGSELASVATRAMARSSARALPTLELDLWDQSVSDTWSGASVAEDEIGVHATAAGEGLIPSACGRYVRYSGPGFAFRLDRDTRHAVGYCESAERLRWWNRSRPLQPLLSAWLAGEGMLLVHAALVARDGRAVILPGPNGAGKSTCALAALTAGLAVLSDDVVAVARDEAQAAGLYTTLKVSRAALGPHPELASSAEPHGEPADDEFLLHLAELTEADLSATTTLSAIAFPRIAASEASSIEPLGDGRALVGLLAQLLAVESGGVQAGFARARRLVGELPVFRLAVGRDSSDLAERLAELCHTPRKIRHEAAPALDAGG